MKKKIIILSIIILIVIVPITINKINQKGNKSYTIETYIDGKLAASLPSSGSGYIVDGEISCTNGASGTFNYSTWRVEVKNISNNSSTKCTVKFKSNEKSFAEYLKNKTCKGDKSSITDDQAKDCLIDENETTDDTKNYRYEGSNPNNYVLFNDELWRIIGVFNVEVTDGGNQNLVKLIRAEALDGLAWNNANTNTWEGGSLQRSLNSGYLNAKDEECYVFSTTVAKTCYFSETGIKDGAREKIEAVKWNIGKTSLGAPAETVFKGETANNSQTSNYYKVGLMSASDYGFAVLGESCTRTTSLGSYGSATCAGQNWLKNVSYEWVLLSLWKKPTRVSIVLGTGSLIDYEADYPFGFRPSVYLKSTVQYVKGSGSYSDPYIIS